MENMNINYFVKSIHILHTDQEIHLSENYGIIYVLEGSLAIKSKTYIYNMNRDDVIAINPNYEFRIESNKEFSVGYLTISGDWVRAMLGFQEDVGFLCNSVTNKNGNYYDLRLLLRRVFLLSSNGLDIDSHFIKDPILRVLHILTLHFQEKEIRRHGWIQGNKSRDSEILDYIYENYKEYIELCDLAERLYLSTCYLSRYFKKQFGLNFSEMLRSIRVNHAADELMETDKPVMAIAMENGFSSIDSYARAFLNIYGLSPAAFRSTHLYRKSSLQREYTVSSKKSLNASTASETIKQNIDIDVDCGRKGVNWRKPWEGIINVGSADYLLQPVFRDHVQILKRDIGFSHVRFHSIYSLKLFLNSDWSDPDYSRIDYVIDFLIHNGMKPYIELGNRDEYSLKIGGDGANKEYAKPPFTSLNEAEIFFLNFVRHLAVRYGTEEVASWYFELGWPCNLIDGEDISQLDRLTEQTAEEYLHTFSIVAKTMRSCIPVLRIGGGGLSLKNCGSSVFRQFLESCKKRQVRPDFVSITCFPCEPDTVGEKLYDRLFKGDFLNFVSLEAREAMNGAGFGDLPLHVSEYGHSVHRMSFNDSTKAGAFLMRSFIACIGIADIIGYRIASDSFADPWDETNLLFGGCGLINKNCIPKPTFYAFLFLHDAEGFLIAHGSNYLITKKDARTWYIACCYCETIMGDFTDVIKEKNRISDISGITADGHKFFRFKLNNVENGVYKILKRSVNSKHGSVLDEWCNLGSEPNPDCLEMEYIRNASTPRLTKEQYEASNGSFSFTTELENGEIQIIQVRYIGY